MTTTSDDTLTDDTRLRRAGHGSDAGRNTNCADHGLVVHGNDVLATGLFAWRVSTSARQHVRRAVQRLT
jgi:hypothetical protein